MTTGGPTPRHRDVRRWASAALLLTVAVFLPARAAGAAQPQTELLRQRVGVYVLDISGFDVATGIFNVDLYLTFRCNRPCDPHFDFRNGSIQSSQVRQSEDLYKEYRVRAQLQEPRVNLRRFPVTEGRLVIELEDDILDDTRMVFEVDPASAIDGGAHLPGYELDRGLRGAVQTHRTSLFGAAYSSAAFSVGYRSHRLSVMVKDLLPLALLTFAGLLGFVIDAEDTADRVLVTISTLLAVAFFGSALTARVPHTDYLTFADVYVITELLLLTAGLAGLILIYDRRRRWHAARVKRMNARIGVGVFLVWAAAHAAFFVLLLA